ncbi:hypothetical protein [Paraferrimonas sp. SM1919]|uniref:hypothetical protein n=1 Tax=Paraferrimonas sp. SM1919 TaxID=2662263 RepID=UPI0013D027E5|nr:hypothetical protein [Paraferrimonas sp. SM1919]
MPIRKILIFILAVVVSKVTYADVLKTTTSYKNPKRLQLNPDMKLRKQLENNQIEVYGMSTPIIEQSSKWLHFKQGDQDMAVSLVYMSTDNIDWVEPRSSGISLAVRSGKGKDEIVAIRDLGSAYDDDRPAEIKIVDLNKDGTNEILLIGHYDEGQGQYWRLFSVKDDGYVLHVKEINKRKIFSSTGNVGLFPGELQLYTDKVDENGKRVMDDGYYVVEVEKVKIEDAFDFSD